MATRELTLDEKQIIKALDRMTKSFNEAAKASGQASGQIDDSVNGVAESVEQLGKVERNVSSARVESLEQGARALQAYAKQVNQVAQATRQLGNLGRDLRGQGDATRSVSDPHERSAAITEWERGLTGIIERGKELASQRKELITQGKALGISESQLRDAFRKGTFAIEEQTQVQKDLEEQQKSYTGFNVGDAAKQIDVIEQRKKAQRQQTQAQKEQTQVQKQANKTDAETQKVAKELGVSEKQLTDAMNKSGLAARNAATAQNQLNKARSQGAGGGGGTGGGDNRSRGGGGGAGIAGQLTKETVESTKAINAFEKTVNQMVAATTKSARRYTRDIQKQFEVENSIFDKRGESYEKLQKELNRIQTTNQNERSRNEKQAQAEVDRIINDNNKRFVSTEKRRFEDNKRLRKDDLKNRQIAANNAIDLLFQSSSKQNQIRERDERNAQKSLDRQIRAVDRARRVIEVGLLEIFFTLHSLSRPISEITNALERFTTANISASAQIEKFASTLESASGDAFTASSTLERLLEITAELTAIDTPGLIQLSARLQTAGLTAEQAENAIVGVTKRMEEQGKSASETRRVMEQFVQAINANLITMQDFRPILREYPLLYRDFSAALGTTITDLDSLRDAADDAGGATNAIVTSLNYVASVAEGAKLDTLVRQFDELKDRAFVLQATLGDVLRPVILKLLKVGNDFLEWIQNSDGIIKTLISTLAVATLGLGKFLGAIIQLGIIAVVVAQLIGATQQINAMTVSINALNAGLTGANVQAAVLPAHLTRIANGFVFIQKLIAPVLIGLGSLTLLVPLIISVVNKLREHTRKAAEEYDTFLSVLNKIPDSVYGGTSAMEAQIKTLIDYRNTLNDTQQELKGTFDLVGRLQKLDTIFTLDFLFSNKSLSEVFEERGGSSLDKRLEELSRQANLTEKNIRDLSSAFNIDISQFEKEIKNQAATLEELEINALDAITSLVKYGRENESVANQADDLLNVMSRLIDEFNKLIDLGLEKEARKILISISELTPAFINWNEQLDAEKVRNYGKELIELDFAIRRLEIAFRALDAEDFVGALGDISDINKIETVFKNLIDNLRKEAEVSVAVAEKEGVDSGKTQQEIGNDTLRIEKQLAFDIENLERQKAELIDKIAKESADRRIEHIKRRVKAENDAVKAERLIQEQRNKDELALAQAQEDRDIKRFNQRLELRRKQAELAKKQLEQRLADELALAQAQEDRDIKRFNQRLELRRKQAEVEKKQREKELKEIQEFEQRRRLIIEHSRAATEARDNAERNRERLSEIETIADQITSVANDAIRENDRLIRRFSGGLSRAFTDFIYDGESTFTEFLTEFAKTTTQIIVQEKLTAEIRKHISDDLTRHQIVNIQKVAAAQVAQGATAATFTPAAAAAVSPVSSFLSGGLGSLALIGLTIAPFLVRAIKDGFDDTEVNLDGREVGKANARNTSRLVREGRVRL